VPNAAGVRCEQPDPRVGRELRPRVRDIEVSHHQLRDPVLRRERGFNLFIVSRLALYARLELLVLRCGSVIA